MSINQRKESKRRVECLECGGTVRAKLVKGFDLEPENIEVANRFFYQCGVCKNYVGCHGNIKCKTKPLGAIPSEVIKQARKRVYNGMNILVAQHNIPLKEVYRKMDEAIGKRTTIAKINSIEEAVSVLKALQVISDNIAIKTK